MLALLICPASPGLWAQTNWSSFVPFQTIPPLHDAAAVAVAISNVPLTAGLVFDPTGQITNTQIWNFGTNIYTGIVDVSPTLERIRRGLSVYNSEPDDGEFFNFTDPNQLTNIPRVSNNYYMEFVVWPGSDMDLDAGTYNTNALPYGSLAWAGTMRLIIGLGGEVYFTGDHYGEAGPQQYAYYVNPVPEPPTAWLAALGVVLLIVLGRRRAAGPCGRNRT